MLVAILKWELMLYARRFGDVLNLLAMFIIISSFFVMSMPHGIANGDMAVGVSWVCAMLVMSLVQYRIFLADFEDGSLEQWLFYPLPLELIVLMKALAHWLINVLPLILAVPLILLLLSADNSHILSAMFSIAIGSISFIFIGMIGAAISLRFNSRDLLTTLLVLPLAVPILIFGAAASLQPISFSGEWLVIFAYILLAVPLSCVVSASLLRLSVE